MRASASLVSFAVRFDISRARILFSHHVVVTVEAAGLRGAGSGVLYRSTPWTARQLWHRRVRPGLAALAPEPAGWETTWPAWLEAVARSEPGLAFAADAALWDLRGRAVGQPVAALLGGAFRETVPVTEQLFLGNWTRSEAALGAILARGTRRVKLKIGLGPAHDLELVRRVRAVVGPDVELRIDANRAYRYDESLALYRQLAGLGVLALEEPLREPWPALSQLREATGLPVMLDESVLSLDDLQAAVAARAIDSLNLKLTRVGGLSPALAYRRACDQAGVAVSIGCNEDLGPGMAAIVHLAAATPGLYAMEGVGHLRLGVDLVDEPMPIVAGHVAVPAGAGLGVHLPEDWQARLAPYATVLDLDTASARQVRGFSLWTRTRQRATNLMYRALRRLSLGRRAGWP
jgi:L-alanine-DL-glutamate epimerase-like enolase superfamily enzyme